MLNLYQVLKKRILNIDSSVKEEYKKLYIAFKSSTNFVDIVPQIVRLRLSLNIDYPDMIEQKGLCKDVSDLGRWGNGDVEVLVLELPCLIIEKRIGWLICRCMRLGHCWIFDLIQLNSN